MFIKLQDRDESFINIEGYKSFWKTEYEYGNKTKKFYIKTKLEIKFYQ